MHHFTERDYLSHGYTMLLIPSMQIGVGILGFQRIIAKSAEQDAWISVLFAGILTYILILLMYWFFYYSNQDLIQFHESFFGKWLGKVCNFALLCYATMSAVTILRTYTEVLQTWVFPQLNIWMFTLIFLVVVWYINSNGFQSIAGISLFTAIAAVPMIFLKYYPLQEADLANLMPVWNHSPTEILTGAKDTSITFLGYENLLFYYGILKRPKQSLRYSLIGNTFTLVVYLVSIISALTYFSLGQLSHTVWATITQWKIVALPFLDRFEYIGIAIWMFAIIPNVCIGLWSANYCLVSIINRSKATKYTLPFLIVVVWIICNQFNDRLQINMLNTMMSKIGFAFTHGYILLLVLLAWIYRKVRSKRHEENSSSMSS